MRTLWLRDRALDLDRVRLLGVLNLTPDSFSDGGRYLDPERGLERAREMVAEGADILDLGAESTRPGAAPVPVEEEKRRLLPVLEAVLSLGVPVSVDTRKPEVAEEALKLGAHLLNDVTGLRDERMVALAARHGVAAVVMHMPVPDPATMMAHARYRDVVAEVKAFLDAQACPRWSWTRGSASGSFWSTTSPSSAAWTRSWPWATRSWWGFPASAPSGSFPGWRTRPRGSTAPWPPTSSP